MAKLIFTSRYLKDAKPSQKENYVHYIGTRKGVEKIDTSKKHLPATVSQKKLVHQLLQDFPATKEKHWETERCCLVLYPEEKMTPARACR